MQASRLFALFLLVLCGCATHRTATLPQPVPEVESEEVAEGTAALAVGDLPNLLFLGAVRKDAKLTMVTTPLVSYSSIYSVITLTPPAVGKSSPRTGVENNQAEFNAWVYAYNLPADNDFHVILGDTSTFQPGVTHVINVEVSGRPNTADSVFKAVRTSFLSVIGNPPTLPRSSYICVGSPFYVLVRGGPFWDTAHPSGGAGTTCSGQSIKTSNGWEIHPATQIY